MRYQINLATEPYIDARLFYRRWLPLLSILVIITATLLAVSVSRHHQLKNVQAEIDATRAKIKKADAERSEGEALMQRPENLSTREQAQFLNQLFLRKSFSWSQVLAELEKITPQHVQVASIRPQLQADGSLLIQFSINAPQRDDAIEFVKHLEDSPRFSKPRVSSEGPQPTGSGTSFQVSALYVGTPSREVR